MNTWDVIVVGAGPVGSYLSRRLAEKGYRVLLLDQKGKTGRRICAGVIGAEAFQRFPLPRCSILYTVDSITMVSPSGKRLRHATKEPMAYVVDRVAFDRALLEEALDKGVEFANLSRVLSVEKTAMGMEVRCKRLVNGGEVMSFRASLVVLATGYTPGLLASLGLPGYPGAVVGIQTVNLMRDVEEIEVYLGRNVAPDGFAWLVPVGNGKVRAGLVVERDARLWLERFVYSSRVMPRVVENHGPVKATWIPRGPIPKTYGDGFLVVGEAAGQVKATTYGGVYYGLICAEHALSTIEEAFRLGNFQEEVLSGYQEAWRREIGEELELGAKLREEARRFTDEDVDHLFVLLGSDGLLPRLRAAVRFDWHKDAIRLFVKHRLMKSIPFERRIVEKSIDSGRSEE